VTEQTAQDVLLPPELEDRVRAFAEALLIKRSEAFRLLVEAGLHALQRDDDAPVESE